MMTMTTTTMMRITTMTTITTTTTTAMKTKYSFKSIKCHTFLESQAQADLNDYVDNNDNDNNDDNDNNNNNINDCKVFFSKVSSVIPFRNHKLKPI